jgi:flagellin
MQSEVGNLTAQISDVLNNTLFNGNNVFKVMTSTPATDGSDDLTLDIQAGANTTNVVTCAGGVRWPDPVRLGRIDL